MYINKFCHCVLHASTIFIHKDFRHCVLYCMHPMRNTAQVKSWVDANEDVMSCPRLQVLVYDKEIWLKHAASRAAAWHNTQEKAKMTVHVLNSTHACGGGHVGQHTAARSRQAQTECLSHRQTLDSVQQSTPTPIAQSYLVWHPHLPTLCRFQ